MKILGLIPARGGSKGVPKKNIRLVDGKPLIHYAIECGQQSKLLTMLLVDTDNDEIAAVCSSTGITVLKRPAELAQDESSVVNVTLRVIQQIEQEKTPIDILVLLQPTSPIRTGINIDEAIERLIANPSADAVISVVAMEDTHPARMYQLKGNELIPLHPEIETKRRQDLEPVYYRNGCIYAIRVDALKKVKSFMPSNKLAYIMPSKWLANIDDERDLIITEALVKAWKNGVI
jgi:CMP-N,N'-diacetyllegionaminic acid synthase